MLTLTAPGEERHRLPSGEWCPCTPEGGVHLGEWNGSMTHRWSRFIDAVRYRWGDVQFFAAKEVQRRGALHVHAPMIFPAGARVRLSEVRALAIAHGFGHAVALDKIEAGSRRAARAAWYCAKYVTKAAGEREAVPFVHRRTGEVAPGRWRTWTASRRWGSSMAAVRAAQREWVRAGGVGECSTLHGVEPGPKAPLDPNTLSSGTVPGERHDVGGSLPM